MDTAHTLHLTGRAAILDIRETDEWRAGHIPGAIHMPLGEIGKRLGEIGSRTWLTVCRNGSRSDRVTGYLRESGRDVRVIRGGMRAWADAGLPYSADNGDPGTVI